MAGRNDLMEKIVSALVTKRGELVDRENGGFELKVGHIAQIVLTAIGERDSDLTTKLAEIRARHDRDSLAITEKPKVGEVVPALWTYEMHRDRAYLLDHNLNRNN